MTEVEERCSGCGLAIAGGDEGCNALLQDLNQRAFTDVRYGRLLSMGIDIYALQHPARYCRSAKSLAAHLCGLCGIVERDQEPALPNMALRAWLDGSVDIAKPELPSARGTMTIADLLAANDPEAFGDTVWRWGRDVWSAYEPLHPVARAWLDRAEATSSRQRHGRKTQ